MNKLKAALSAETVKPPDIIIVLEQELANRLKGLDEKALHLKSVIAANEYLHDVIQSRIKSAKAFQQIFEFAKAETHLDYQKLHGMLIPDPEFMKEHLEEIRKIGTEVVELKATSSHTSIISGLVSPRLAWLISPRGSKSKNQQDSKEDVHSQITKESKSSQFLDPHSSISTGNTTDDREDQYNKMRRNSFEYVRVNTNDELVMVSTNNTTTSTDTTNNNTTTTTSSDTSHATTSLSPRSDSQSNTMNPNTTTNITSTAGNSNMTTTITITPPRRDGDDDENLLSLTTTEHTPNIPKLDLLTHTEIGDSDNNSNSNSNNNNNNNDEKEKACEEHLNQTQTTATTTTTSQQQQQQQEDHSGSGSGEERKRPEMASLQTTCESFLAIQESIIDIHATFAQNTSYLLGVLVTTIRDYFKTVDELKKRFEKARGEYYQALTKVAKERGKIYQEPVEGKPVPFNIQKLVLAEKELARSWIIYEDFLTELLDLLHGEDHNIVVGRLILQFLEIQKRYFERIQKAVMEYRVKVKGLELWTNWVRERTRDKSQTRTQFEEEEKYTRKQRWSILIDLLVTDNSQILRILVEMIPELCNSRKADELYSTIDLLFTLYQKPVPPTVAKKMNLLSSKPLLADEILTFDSYIDGANGQTLLKFICYNIDPIAQKLFRYKCPEFLRFCSLITCLSVWDIANESISDD